MACCEPPTAQPHAPSQGPRMTCKYLRQHAKFVGAVHVAAVAAAVLVAPAVGVEEILAET